MCPPIWACVSRIICGFEARVTACGGADILCHGCAPLGCRGECWRCRAIFYLWLSVCICVYLLCLMRH
jgi:hypothetical protein